MSQGKSNGQIGRELYLSEDTVKTHARRLFRKLGVRDRRRRLRTDSDAVWCPEPRPIRKDRPVPTWRQTTLLDP